MSLYSQLAETLQFLVPTFYKERFFKNLVGITRLNINDRKVEPELLWIKDYLGKDAVFFDIGANVGAYIFRLENHLRNENIFAFEPNKKLYKRLVRIFPHVRLFPLALSSTNEIAEFKIPFIKGKETSSRGTLQVHMQEAEESSVKIEKVKVIRLDDWAGIRELSKIDFIKIDVEGNEIATLQGAKNTINRFKPTLMVEFEQRHHREPIWNNIQIICDWGFDAFYLDRKTLSLAPLKREIVESQNSEDIKKYEKYINNIIFVPR